jgi:voltage-gated potassium channel
MKDTALHTVREILVAFTAVFIFLFLAASIISSYAKVDIVEAFRITITHIITLGGGGGFGNIFYFAIIFVVLGIMYYMFERFIVLFTEVELIGGIKMVTRLSLMKNHYIVCGAGRVGIHVAEKLKEKGKKVLIIENNPQEVKEAKIKGFLVIEGDCLHEHILEKARIKKAKGIVACMGRDDANIFLVLTAKDLNPKIKVATRANDLKVVGEFKRAGANYIVAPEVSGGFELAEKIVK